MKKIKLKSQPKWIARAMFGVGAVTGLLLALHTHPIGGTNALNEDGTSEFMHYEEVAGKGTITICDPDSGGTRCITMMDRNLGATKAGTGCSVLDTGACGNHYQWGNNYEFANPRTGSADDSITNSAVEFDVANVDASVYGPGNYYSSGTFIKDYSSSNGGDWSLTRNDNLRGGSGDNESSKNYGYDTGTMQATNVTGRQGPCPTDYHVPSVGERGTLLKYWVENYTETTPDTITLDGSYPTQILSGYSTASTQFQNDFKIPFAGYRNIGSILLGVGSYAQLWSSSPGKGSGHVGARPFTLSSNLISASVSNGRAYGRSVRCFKNTPLTYPSIITIVVMDGETVIRSGEVEIGSTLPDEAIQTLNEYANSKTGQSFSGWYDEASSQWRNPESTVTTGLNLRGYRTRDEYSISYDLAGGEFPTGESITNTYTYGTTGFNLINPVRTWYTFSGWTRSGQTEPQTIVTISEQIGDKNFTANWTPIHDVNNNGIADEEESFIVTWKDGNTVIGTSLVLYGEMPDFTPIKDGYTFSGWTPALQAMTGEVEYSAIWTQIPRSSGGGGARLRKDNCPGGDFSDSYYDGVCGYEKTSTDSKNSGNGNGGKHGSSEEFQFNTLKFDPNYSDEMNKAYQYAYYYGITTKDTIKDADMTGKLTRIATAKMLSQYAINVLGKTPDKTRIKQFDDVSQRLDLQYNNGVTLAYQLGIMGINMGNNFNPNSYVTRAEFATALSRLLYNTPDGTFAGTEKYYIPHMSKLAYEGIINQTDPTMLERRGYVMLMLMRSSMK